jgi:NAD(P)-dependent dehydrogenase (short-subunit alcohol dehydrogenase family)
MATAPDVAIASECANLDTLRTKAPHFKPSDAFWVGHNRNKGLGYLPSATTDCLRMDAATHRSPWAVRRDRRSQSRAMGPTEEGEQPCQSGQPARTARSGERISLFPCCATRRRIAPNAVLARQDARRADLNIDYAFVPCASFHLLRSVTVGTFDSGLRLGSTTTYRSRSTWIRAIRARRRPFRRVVDVNLNGAFNCISTLLPSMRACGGGTTICILGGHLRLAADRAGLLRQQTRGDCHDRVD